MRKNPLIRWQLWVLGGVTLLLLFRVISGPPSREGLVVLERMDAESLQYNAFEVDRTVRMSIEGQGSFESEDSDSERLAAYAWILDAETREPVWQMDPANVREAIREVLLDVEEGADIVMVKPGLPYLDVVRQVRDAVQVPVAAYQVSGEYAMIQAVAQNGWMDSDQLMLETLTAFRRAGSDMVLTYFAHRAAQVLGG